MTNLYLKGLITLLNSYRLNLNSLYNQLDKTDDPITIQDLIDEIRMVEAAIQATEKQIENIEVE